MTCLVLISQQLHPHHDMQQITLPTKSCNGILTVSPLMIKHKQMDEASTLADFCKLLVVLKLVLDSLAVQSMSLATKPMLVPELDWMQGDQNNLQMNENL